MQLKKCIIHIKVFIFFNLLAMLIVFIVFSRTENAVIQVKFVLIRDCKRPELPGARETR